jgi:hypothetical protein
MRLCASSIASSIPPAVVLFGDRQIATPGANWPSLLHAIGMELVPDRMAQRRQSDPAWEPHETVLVRSPFPHLTLHGMTVARTLSVDDIVGLAYSRSITSPEALGAQRETFERRLRDGLAELAPDGRFNEIVEIRALIARRSAGVVTAWAPATRGREHVRCAAALPICSVLVARAYLDIS